MKTIATAVSGRDNNFDALRLFAALLVLWSHSYPLTKTEPEPFVGWFGGYDNGGGLGVTIFFAISGFLVTRSATERGAFDYIVARVLRIVPALAFVTIVTIFVIGPLLTHLSLIDYFKDRSTRQYLLNVLVFDVHFRLSDTTATLPYKNFMNGSLWTLPLECGFYVILLFLAKAKALTEKLIPLLVLAVGVAALYTTLTLHLDWANQGPTLWRGAMAYPALRYGIAFVLGSAFWVYREKVPLDGGLALSCVLALLVASKSDTAQAVYLVTVPYLVLYLSLGIQLKARALKPIGDLSYGVYLFAFPIQQTIIGLLGPSISPIKVSLLATPIVLIVAYFSWWFIEKPSLSLKGSALSATRVKVGAATFSQPLDRQSQSPAQR